MSTCRETDDPMSSTSASQLGMDNLGGVFVFLVGGLALALIIAVLEFLVIAVVNSKTDRVRFSLGYKHYIVSFSFNRILLAYPQQALFSRNFRP